MVCDAVFDRSFPAARLSDLWELRQDSFVGIGRVPRKEGRLQGRAGSLDAVDVKLSERVCELAMAYVYQEVVPTQEVGTEDRVLNIRDDDHPSEIPAKAQVQR